MKSKFNKKLISLILPILLITSLLIGLKNIKVYAETNTKVIIFEESNSNVRSKTVTIPDLRNITSITSDTGNLKYNISGNDITLNISGGSPSRSAWNSTKYSEVVTNTKTQASYNEFPDTIDYTSSDGYIGTLNKTGTYTSEVISGSPSGSISAKLSISNSNNVFDDITSYSDSNGYSGMLNKDGLSYVSGGAYTKAWNEKVYDKESKGGYFSWWSYATDLDSLTPTDTPKDWCGGSTDYGNPSMPDDFPSNWDVDTTKWADIKKWDSTWGYWSRKTYIGYKHFTLVKHPELDTRIYTQSYIGTATKPDTRVWNYTQLYSGTAYKGGNDNYYSYKVTINYTSNIIPSLTLTSPVNNESFSENKNMIISGIVNDKNTGDTLKIFYRFDNGNEKQLGSEILSNAVDHNFSNTADIGLLSQGSHTLYVWALDSFGEKSEEISRTFIIDKMLPTGTFNPISSDWTNKDIVVNFNPYDDGGAKVSYWRYRISKDNGNSYGEWSSNINGNTASNIVLTEEGINKINVEIHDNANNINSINSEDYKIDKTLPTADITISDHIDNSNTYIPVNFTNIKDNLSGVSKISASIYSDYKTNSVIINNPGTNTIINVPREKLYNNATIYAEIEDYAGNIKKCELKTFLEPYKPDIPVIMSPIDDTLLIGNEPVTIMWNYSDPTNFPQTKAVINFTETMTQDKYNFNVDGTKNSITLIPCLPQGQYNLSVTVYNSQNKMNTSLNKLIRQESYKSEGVIYTQTINKGMLLSYVSITSKYMLPSKSLETNGHKNTYKTNINGYILLPDKNGLYDNNAINIENTIPFTITSNLNNIPIRLPRKVSELKIMIKMTTENKDITPTLESIKIYAR